MIIESTYSPIYGKIRYYEADRFLDVSSFLNWNQNKIVCDEVVSFDCGLFDLYEMEKLNQPLRNDTQQIMAVIVEPSEEPNLDLEKDDFVFCGYDLVEEATAISAITNCGGSFTSIPYDKLTEYGLLPTYKDAVLTQCALLEEDPDEPHADCVICKIWRKIVNA